MNTSFKGLIICLQIAFGMQFDTVSKENHPFADTLHLSLSGFAEVINNPYV